MLNSHKEQPGSVATSSMMLRHNSYHSNGFDVARIASYKSELRRLSERFYVRGASAGGECGGGVGLRRCFLVRDLRGDVWRVQQRGNLEGLQAVRHRSQKAGPMGDGQRMFQKNRVLLAPNLGPKGPMVLPDKSTSVNSLRGQTKRGRQRQR